MNIYLMLKSEEKHFFANEADFRASSYTNALLDLMDLDGYIDLTTLSIVDGQIATFVHPDGLYLFSSSLQDCFSYDDVCYSELQGHYILNRYRCWSEEDNTWASQRWMVNNGYVHVEGSEGYYNVDNGNIAVAADTHRWYHVDELTWDEDSDSYWKHHNPALYLQTIQHSHATVEATKMLEPESRVQLGYEVEKDSFITIDRHSNEASTVRRRGAHVGEYAFFRGFELDDSGCVEAPSHIIPGDLKYMDYVIGLAADAANIFNSDISRACGGHINMSVRGVDKIELAVGFKAAMPFLMSIWRKRVGNRFCFQNTMLEFRDSRKWGQKFACINMRKSNDIIELRLPPAVVDLDDIIFRHKLIANCLDITIIQGIQDFATIHKLLLPIFKERYGDETEQMLSLAPMFNHSIYCESHTDLKPEAEIYFADYISAERQREIRIEREIVQRELERVTREAVELGLRSTRRRHRTVELGDSFPVSCMIDGVRRQRSIHVSGIGFTFNRGHLLQINPEDIDITIMASGDVVTFTERTRGGEFMCYVSNVLQPSRTGTMCVSTTRWSRPRRIHDRSNIFSYWHNNVCHHLAIEDGVDFFAAVYERRWLNGSWTDETLTQGFAFDWENTQWTEISTAHLPEIHTSLCV